MTRDEIQACVNRFLKAWSAEDLEGLLECYDKDAELHSPMLHTQRGIDAIERAHQDLFLALSETVLDLQDVVIDAEAQSAVAVFTMHATQRGELLGFPASGRRTETPMAFIFHFKDNRIVGERRLYDFTGVLMQLGILKARSV